MSYLTQKVSKKNNMKSKIKILDISLLLSVTLLNAQDDDAYLERFEIWYRNNPELGGDVTLLISIMRVSEGNAYTEFKLIAEEEGEYFLNLWVSCGRNIIDGTTETHEVYVNDIFYGTVTAPTAQWQAVALSNKVHLNEGLNIVSVVNQLRQPQVEFVRLSKDEERARIPTLSDTSNDNLFLSKISIYPNPAIIGSSLSIKSEEIIKHIIIYDLSGRLICTKNMNSNSGNISLVELNINNPGMYIINTHSDRGIKSQKLIIKQ